MYVSLYIRATVGHGQAICAPPSFTMHKLTSEMAMTLHNAFFHKTKAPNLSSILRKGFLPMTRNAIMASSAAPWTELGKSQQRNDSKYDACVVLNAAQTIRHCNDTNQHWTWISSEGVTELDVISIPWQKTMKQFLLLDSAGFPTTLLYSQATTSDGYLCDNE